MSNGNVSNSLPPSFSPFLSFPLSLFCKDMSICKFHGEKDGFQLKGVRSCDFTYSTAETLRKLKHPL